MPSKAEAQANRIVTAFSSSRSNARPRVVAYAAGWLVCVQRFALARQKLGHFQVR